MGKSYIDWYTIEIVKHSRINTGDARQLLKGDVRNERIVYYQQLPKTDISGLVAAAEALSNPDKVQSAKGAQPTKDID